MIIADIIKYIHLSLFFIVIFGWLVPCNWLPYYIIFIIIILLDWNDLDGMCILTKMENYFRYGVWEAKSPLEGGPEFFRPMINKALNLNLTTIQAERLNNFIFIFCLLLGVLRFITCYQRLPRS